MEEKTLSLPQGHVAYLVNEHKPNQPNVLALHGWLDNAASFKPLMPHLQQYNVYAVDLPGHGHSFHRPPYCHYHFIDWVSDLAEIADGLFGDEKFTLLGHSLGGMLSTVFAAMYPALVNKLILIDAAGLITQDADDPVNEMRKALISRVKQSTKTKRLHPDLNSAIQARFAAGDLSLDACELLVERNVLTSNEGVQWRTDQRLRTGSPVRINAETAHQIVNSIQAPTMVIILAQQGYDSVKQNFLKYQHRLSTLRTSGGARWSSLPYGLSSSYSRNN